MSKTITIIAETVDGQFLLKPATYNLPCNSVIPVGYQVLRTYDNNMSVVARGVFLVRINETLLGSTQFKTKLEFEQYKAGQCACCAQPAGCFLDINGCHATINSCEVLKRMF